MILTLNDAGYNEASSETLNDADAFFPS